MSISTSGETDQLDKLDTVLKRIHELNILKVYRENSTGFGGQSVSLDDIAFDAEHELLRYDHSQADNSDVDCNRTSERLAQNVDVLRTFCAVQKAFRAPIRRLPKELLLYIFELVCDDRCLLVTLGPFKDEYDVDEREETGIINLSCVCSAWRDTALNTPSLWSVLELSWMHSVSDDRSQQQQQRQLDVLRSVLSRARSSSLDIVFSAWQPSTPQGISFSETVFEYLDPLLSAHCHTLTLTSESMAAVIARPITWNNMHTLDAETSFSSSFDSPEAHADMPILHTLRLTADFPISTHNLQWTSLRFISARDWDIKELQQTLPSCEQLEQLELTHLQSAAVEEMDATDEVIVLERLHTLHLHVDHGYEDGNEGADSPVLCLLSLLVLHALKTLVLDLDQCSSYRPLFIMLSACITRWDCQITTLEISMSSSHLGDFQELCSLCIGLESLNLVISPGFTNDYSKQRDSEVYGQLLQDLVHTLKPDGTSFLPKLTNLALDFIVESYPIHDDLYTTIVDMVSSRRQVVSTGISRLQSFQLTLDVDMDNKSIFQPLEELQGGGLSFKFVHEQKESEVYEPGRVFYTYWTLS